MVSQSKTSMGIGSRGRLTFQSSRQSRPSPIRSQNSRPTDLEASIKRYTALALDAAAGGDQVKSESYFQQAEYYIKLTRGDRD